MNKKKLNTILLIVVTIIWGMALYKFIAPYFNKTELPLAPKHLTKKRVLPIKKKDTLTLIFPTRDPFLGKISKTKKKRPIARKTVHDSKRRKAVTPVEWPTIEYLGFVKSKTSDNPLGLVRIDGKLHRVHLNTVINGLRISQINSDLIQLTSGKESKNFKKK